MRFKKLSRNFYNRNTLSIAQELLGKYLVRQIGQEGQAGRIVETEAYIGQDDDACHASRGKTRRNEVMFGSAGHAYVYMIYGIYWCLNIVTEKKRFPAAVLIRALEPVESRRNRELEISNKELVIRNKKLLKNTGQVGMSRIKTDSIFLGTNTYTLTNGPGKLCRWMKITKELNGEDLVNSDRLWVEDRREKIFKKDIIKTTRVGVDYAQNSKGHPWRFYIKNSPFVSKKMKFF